jgi:hypothetical protein
VVVDNDSPAQVVEVVHKSLPNSLGSPGDQCGFWVIAHSE